MTQLEKVYQFCEGRSGYFTLAEVYEGCPSILCPSVRQLLQKVRDAGLITFVNNKGLYKR